MSHGHRYTSVLASWYVILRWTETVTAHRERVPWLISDEAHETGRDHRRASALDPKISKRRSSHWIFGGCRSLLEIGLITKMRWAFLVAQWQRLHLPMKGTQVWSPVWEEHTALEKMSACTTTVEPVPQSPRAAVTEPVSHRCQSPCPWSPCPTTGVGATRRSPCTATKSRPCSPWPKRAHAQQWRPGMVNQNHNENKWANTSL